jgi:hypothetical protein
VPRGAGHGGLDRFYGFGAAPGQKQRLGDAIAAGRRPRVGWALRQEGPVLGHRRIVALVGQIPLGGLVIISRFLPGDLPGTRRGLRVGVVLHVRAVHTHSNRLRLHHLLLGRRCYRRRRGLHRWRGLGEVAIFCGPGCLLFVLGFLLALHALVVRTGGTFHTPIGFACHCGIARSRRAASGSGGQAGLRLCS